MSVPDEEDGYYEAISDDEDMGGGESSNPVWLRSKRSLESDNFSPDLDALPFVPKFSSEIRNTVEAAVIPVNKKSNKSTLVGKWGSSPLHRSTHTAPVVDCPYFPSEHVSKVLSDLRASAGSHSNTEAMRHRNPHQFPFEPVRQEPPPSVSNPHQFPFQPVRQEPPPSVINPHQFLFEPVRQEPPPSVINPHQIPFEPVRQELPPSVSNPHQIPFEPVRQEPPPSVINPHQFPFEPVRQEPPPSVINPHQIPFEPVRQEPPPNVINPLPFPSTSREQVTSNAWNKNYYQPPAHYRDPAPAYDFTADIAIPPQQQQRPSWFDENGDPLQGAFDDVPADDVKEDPCVSIVDNTRVEYVFHVKEKKFEEGLNSKNVESVGSQGLERVNFQSVENVNSRNSVDFVNSQSVEVLVNSQNSNVETSQGVESCSSGNVALASNLSIEKTNTGGDGSSLSHSGHVEGEEFDQKTLYEASKSKEEYNAAILAASTSEEGKAEDTEDKSSQRYSRFKRNRFLEQSQETVEEPQTEVTTQPLKTEAEKALESQALTELLKEVKQGAERAREYGALGWQKRPVPVVNKTFLRNTLVSTLREPYRPPSKRGQHHVGLGKRKAHQGDDDSSSSRSSRSSSRSSNRSRSSSRSSRSRSRDSRKKGFNNRGRGGWGRGGGGPPDMYYDWQAMEAYAAQYGGFPWYGGPEAFHMYYQEGWPPMDFYNQPGGPWGPPPFYRGCPPPRGRGRGGRGRGGYHGYGGWGDEEAVVYSDDDFISSSSLSPSPSPDGRKDQEGSAGQASKGNSRREREGKGSQEKSGESQKSKGLKQKKSSKGVTAKSKGQEDSDTSSMKDSELKDRKKKKKKKKKKKHKKLKKDDEKDLEGKEEAVKEVTEGNETKNESSASKEKKPAVKKMKKKSDSKGGDLDQSPKKVKKKIVNKKGKSSDSAGATGTSVEEGTKQKKKVVIVKKKKIKAGAEGNQMANGKAKVKVKKKKKKIDGKGDIDVKDGSKLVEGSASICDGSAKDKEDVKCSEANAGDCKVEEAAVSLNNEDEKVLSEATESASMNNKKIEKFEKSEKEGESRESSSINNSSCADNIVTDKEGDQKNGVVDGDAREKSDPEVCEEAKESLNAKTKMIEAQEVCEVAKESVNAKTKTIEAQEEGVKSVECQGRSNINRLKEKQSKEDGIDANEKTSSELGDKKQSRESNSPNKEKTKEEKESDSQHKVKSRVKNSKGKERDRADAGGERCNNEGRKIVKKKKGENEKGEGKREKNQEESAGKSKIDKDSGSFVKEPKSDIANRGLNHNDYRGSKRNTEDRSEEERSKDDDRKHKRREEDNRGKDMHARSHDRERFERSDLEADRARRSGYRRGDERNTRDGPVSKGREKKLYIDDGDAGKVYFDAREKIKAMRRKRDEESRSQGGSRVQEHSTGEDRMEKTGHQLAKNKPDRVEDERVTRDPDGERLSETGTGVSASSQKSPSNSEKGKDSHKKVKPLKVRKDDAKKAKKVKRKKEQSEKIGRNKVSRVSDRCHDAEGKDLRERNLQGNYANASSKS